MLMLQMSGQPPFIETQGGSPSSVILVFGRCLTLPTRFPMGDVMTSCSTAKQYHQPNSRFSRHVLSVGANGPKIDSGCAQIQEHGHVVRTYYSRLGWPLSPKSNPCRRFRVLETRQKRVSTSVPKLGRPSLKPAKSHLCGSTTFMVSSFFFSEGRYDSLCNFADPLEVTAPEWPCRSGYVRIAISYRIRNHIGNYKASKTRKGAPPE